MEIEINDERVSDAESDRWKKTKLPLSVVKSIRRKLPVLRAAPDERTLRNWKSLHYEKLEGERKDQRSIRLNDQWRLVFGISSTDGQQRLTGLKLVDYH